jgi:hypothetical protein
MPVLDYSIGYFDLAAPKMAAKALIDESFRPKTV